MDVERDGLTFVALIGIVVILRCEVPDAVNLCKERGIQVRIATSESLILASRIAERCGIINES